MFWRLCAPTAISSSIFGGLAGQSYKKGGTTLKKKRRIGAHSRNGKACKAKIKRRCRHLWPCPSHQSAYCLPSILMIIVKQLVYIIRPLVNIITKAYCLLHALALSLLDFLWGQEVVHTRSIYIGSGSALVTDKASYEKEAFNGYHINNRNASAHCNQLHLHCEL